MNKLTYCKRFMLWTAIIAAVLFTIFHILTFKVIEANVFEEVTKRILVSAGVIGILEVFAYILAPLFWHIKYDGKSSKEDESLD